MNVSQNVPPKHVPSVTQFDNRLKEILDIDPQTISTKKDAENFINAIVDWVDFIEGDAFYSEVVETIFKNEEYLAAQQELTEAANKILTHLKRMLTSANKFVTTNKMKLPTWDEVINAHLNQGVYSPTVAESLGSDLGWLEKMKKEGLPLNDVEHQVGNMFHTRFDFETLIGKHPYTENQLTKLQQLHDDYKAKLHSFEEVSRTTGISTYSDLRGVWEWRKGQQLSYNQMEILTGALAEIIQSSNFSSGLYSIADVRKEAQAYQGKVRSAANRIGEVITKGHYTFGKRFGRRSKQVIVWAINRAIGFIKPTG